MKIKKFIIPTILIFTTSESIAGIADYLYLTQYENSFTISYNPYLLLGTHRDGLGYNGEIGYWMSSFLPGRNHKIFQIKIDLNTMLYQRYFGIPGMYFLRLTTMQNTMTKKIMVAH